MPQVFNANRQSPPAWLSVLSSPKFFIGAFIVVLVFVYSGLAEGSMCLNGNCDRTLRSVAAQENPQKAVTAQEIPIDAEDPAVEPPMPVEVYPAPYWKSGSSSGYGLPPLDARMWSEEKRFPEMHPLPKSYKTPPVNLEGQVTLETTFGAELNRLGKQADIHLVLEIGTWYGGGSSWCLGQGLRESIKDPAKPNKWMITMEMFKPAYDHAAATLVNLPVTCLQAGTVGVDGYLPPQEIPNKDEHYRLYYDRDIELAKKAPAALNALCESYNFDLVLLDGNEYTGYAEFLIVRDVCKPKYIALHDCGTLKTHKVQEWLHKEGEKDWELIATGKDAAAWAVYRYKH